MCSALVYLLKSTAQCSKMQYCSIAVLWSALVSLPSADCTHLPGSKEGGGDLWWRKDVQDNDENDDDDPDDDDDLDGLMMMMT